jgi:hypothetical protein
MYNAALISVDEITNSWLLKKGKTYHSWWKILPIACEALQELSLTSLPMVNHVELTKPEGQTWFNLPDGFTDWVSVAIRVGNRWVPISASTRLMPYPNSCDSGGQFNGQFDDSFKKRGDWKSWLNRECKYGNADFFEDDFFGDDFSEEATISTQPENINKNYFGFGNIFPFWDNGTYNTNQVGEFTQGRFGNVPRPDEVQFNVEKRIIMCPDNFPSSSLYLVYVGIGKADTMTNVPVKAQAAIEAYIDWKYAANKRNNLAEARMYKSEYDNQHRLLRARYNTLNTSAVRRIVDRGYERAGGLYNNFGATTTYPTSSNINYYTKPFLVLYANAGTFVQSPELVGKTIGFVIIVDVMKNTGFVLNGDTLNFIDGTYFSGGEKITIVYE